MKTITNEIKAKYFALYYGQKVLYNGCDTVVVNGSYNWLHPSHILVLTPLESISDEDAKKFGFKNKDSFLIGCFDDKTIIDLDLVRQLGYATKFTTIIDGKVIMYSANDLIELNVIKLKK